MKKTFNKMKTRLATLGVVIVSFFSKVFGQELDIGEMLYGTPQLEYGVPSPISPAIIVSKIVQRSLIGVTFIVGIVNLIRIRKTKDKAEKKEKIKRFIIIISVLVVLIAVSFIVARLLKR